MPLKYKIIKSKNIVYVIGSGFITFSELMRHIDELAHDPDYKAPMKKLVDYRNIESLDLSMNESEIFAQKKQNWMIYSQGKNAQLLLFWTAASGWLESMTPSSGLKKRILILWSLETLSKRRNG